MSLFLPKNVQPLQPASNISTWSDDSKIDVANTDFFKIPKGLEKRSVEIGYKQL